MCTVMNFGIPQNSGILFTDCEPIIFSRITLLLGGSFVREVSKNMSYKKELMNCSITGSFQTSLQTQQAVDSRHFVSAKLDASASSSLFLV